MTATPTELAICWVMLSSVEPRATSWWVSVFSADVMIGIIVPPMPRPITNSTGMMKPQCEVSASIWVSANMPPMMSDQPERHDPPDRDLVGERAGDRHGQHRADALRGDQPAGVQRRLAAHLLEELGHQQQAAEERRGEDEHRQDRRPSGCGSEQPQVEQRVLGPERVDHERRPSGPGRPGPAAAPWCGRCRPRRGSTRRRRGTAPARGTSSACRRSRTTRTAAGCPWAARTRRRPAAMRPIGTLIRKIQCQLKWSISQPPRIGPKIGPSSIGTPRMAISRPIRAGPAARVMIVMPSGMSMPPPRPCSTRKPISMLDRGGRGAQHRAER